eukprot:symbB.v1.2.008031.t1/scaffold490.1/size198488/2
MNQTRKTQSAPNLSGYSRIPSVSRAIPFACRGRSVDANSQLQVEFIGGTARWRFVEDEDEVPKSQKKHSKQVACSYARPSSKPCLHEVTIAGGWGQKSAREKRLEKLASKLGYLPGMPRMKGGESRLDSFLPTEYRAGSFKDFKPSPAPIARSSYAGKVTLETRQHLKILKMPPDGDRLVVKRWTSGFFEVSSRE